MLRRMRRSPRCFFVVILGCLLLVSCLLPKHDGPVLVAGWSSGRNRAPSSSSSSSVSSMRTEKSHSRIHTTVTIIGAGAAGISAAQVLQEANVEFVMVEGRDRIGGRFQQTELGTSGYIVEEGANWIHGPLRVNNPTTTATNSNDINDDIKKNNPLWEYAVQYNLAGNYTNYTKHHMTAATEGTRIPTPVTQYWSSRVDQALDYCEDKSQRVRRQWFQQQQQQQQQTVTATTEELDSDRGGVEDEEMSIEQCLEECGYYNTTGSISSSSSNSSMTNTSTSNTNATKTTTMMAVGELLAWMKTEFESGQPASSISNTQAFALQDAASYEDRDYLITDQRGYQHWMVRFVEDNLNADQLYLNHTVTKVEAFSEHATNTTVIVTTQEGTQFVSDYVLCTVPLGVLQHQLIDFVPDFSDERWEGIQGMTMGHYAKLYVQFATNFWGKKTKNTTTNKDDDKEEEEAPELLLTTTETRTNGSRSEEALQFPWALNLDLPKYLPGSKILAFHVCCDTARRLETQPLAETVEAAVALLRTKYGMDRVSTVTQVHVTNWTHDRYAGYGSYPDWPVGYTPQQHTAMIAPHGNIHFAGDHTHAQLFGYGHGAILTGRREAKAIISKLETNNDTHTWTTIE